MLNLRKMILTAMTLSLFGCMQTWQPGSEQYVSFRKGLYSELNEKSTKRLLKILKRVKAWKKYDNDPLGRNQKLKMQYYTITAILRDRLDDPGVYQTFQNMTDKYEYDSVARDSIRVLEKYYDLDIKTIDLKKDFVALYSSNKIHPEARNEILNVLVERKLKYPELLWHIRDVRDKLGEDAHLEDVYLGFLNAG